MKKIIMLSLSLLALNLFALKMRTFDAVAECHRCHCRIPFKATEVYNGWNDTWELKTSSLWVPAYCKRCQAEIDREHIAINNMLISRQRVCRSYMVGPKPESKNNPKPKPKHHGIGKDGCGVYMCHGDKCKQSNVSSTH